MPDNLGRQHHALADVGLFLRPLGALALPPNELGKYPLRRAIAGWRLAIEFPDGKRRVDVLFDQYFPRSQARIALVDRPDFLTWAHVEKDGILCLLNGAASVDPYSPVEAVKALLGGACDLIEDLVAGKCVDDLRDEFLSYWDWSANRDTSRVLSLVSPRGPSRLIRVWRGRWLNVVADDDVALHKWLISSGFIDGKRTPKFADGLLVWRDKALLPNEYPHTGNDIATLCDPVALELFGAVLEKRPDRLLTLIGSGGQLGLALGATVLTASQVRTKTRGARVRNIDEGFRPGKAPRQLAIDRLKTTSILSRLSVERVDPSWIHGRDQNEQQPALEDACVTILGCGSIGAAVAVLLAQSGVGRFRLVDGDLLKPANVGRHPLGVRYIGQNKARALAHHIQERFPHIKVEAVTTWWEDMPQQHSLFSDCKLVISTMGDWLAEGVLNEFHLDSGRGTPILYGWTEPLAGAGHAVMIDSAGGCLQCGMDRHGSPHIRATEWPKGPTLQREPACGAVFQPYGPMELSYSIALIAEAALDSILGASGPGRHRVWVNSLAGLAKGGGIRSAHFLKLAELCPQGSFSHYFDWPARADCPQCCAEEIAA